EAWRGDLSSPPSLPGKGVGGLGPALPPPSRLGKGAGESGPALRTARDLADAGELDAALALCRERLDAGETTAELYALLAVLHQARHADDEARRCFQRALYLDPRHEDALVHLLLLHERQGDAEQVALLRRRLERLARGGAT